MFRSPLFRSPLFWGAWTALAFIATASIYGRALIEGAPVSLDAAVIRGFRWMYGDAILMVMGVWLIRRMHGNVFRGRVWITASLGVIILFLPILALRAVELVWRGRTMTAVDWTLVAHFNLKFAATLVATAVAVDLYGRLVSKQSELFQREAELAAEEARRTRALLNPLQIEERFAMIRSEIAVDPDRANQHLVSLAEDMRQCLNIARRAPTEER